MAKKLTCCQIVKKALKKAGYKVGPFKCKGGKPFRNYKGDTHSTCYMEGWAGKRLKRAPRKP